MSSFLSRLMMLSEQASLPNHHRALGWQWLLKCVYDHLTRDTEQQWQHQQQLEEEQREQDLGSGDLPHALVAHMPALNQDLALEVELRQRTLSPSIFDCDGEISLVLYSDLYLSLQSPSPPPSSTSLLHFCCKEKLDVQDTRESIFPCVLYIT